MSHFWKFLALFVRLELLTLCFVEELGVVSKRQSQFIMSSASEGYIY